MSDAERAAMDQSIATTANIWWQMYNCLLNEGFARDQAMQLLLVFVSTTFAKRPE